MKRTTLSICSLSLALLFSTVLDGAEPDGGESNAASKNQSQWITSIAQLGDGNSFVAATANGLLMQPASVDAFNVDSPESRTTLYTHPAAVWAVTCTSDGKTVASVDYRGNLATYNTVTKEIKIHETALERWCQALITEPTNKAVVAGNEAGKISVWDFAEQQIVSSVELDGHAVTGLAISPDQQQLAASDGNGQIHLLKWPSLEIIGKSKVSDAPAWCVAYGSNSEQLLVGCGDNRLYQIASQPEAKPAVIATGKDWITKLAVSKTGSVAAGEVSGGLHVLTDIDSPPSISKSLTAESGVWSLLWSGEKTLLVGTRKNAIARIVQSWDWMPDPIPPKESENKVKTTDETTADEATNDPPPEATDKIQPGKAADDEKAAGVSKVEPAEQENP